MKLAAKRVSGLGLMGVVAFLCGCGPWKYTDFTPGQPIPVTEGALAGNWLLTGSLPAGGSNLTLGVTLDEYGTEVDGAPSDEYTCSGGSPLNTNTIVSPGTLDANGGFTLQSTTTGTNPVYYGMAIEASSSTASPAGFMGTATFLGTNSNCSLPPSVAFTASKIADFTGTYNGFISVHFTGVFLGVSAPATLTLQQGGFPQSGGRNSETVMTGNIAVSLGACFSKGTVIQKRGSVGGFLTNIDFLMDDGSTLSLELEAQDAATKTLVPVAATMANSSCVSGVGASGNFVRQ